MSRYLNSRKAQNTNELYKETMDSKGLKKIIQFRTPVFKKVPEELFDQVETSLYIWKYGDSYWALASKYYGDPTLWWVIAGFNKKPSETILKIGDEIKIPLNLSQALQVL
jgi:nucleoid-associated protein YgaU